MNSIELECSNNKPLLWKPILPNIVIRTVYKINKIRYRKDEYLDNLCLYSTKQIISRDNQLSFKESTEQIITKEEFENNTNDKHKFTKSIIVYRGYKTENNIKMRIACVIHTQNQKKSIYQNLSRPKYKIEVETNTHQDDIKNILNNKLNSIYITNNEQELLSMGWSSFDGEY